jgi:energy-converting hydrogenase Eha subunit A
VNRATQQHPTGLTAMGTTILIWVLGAAGVDMPPEVAAAVVGLTSALMSAFTPRTAEA